MGNFMLIIVNAVGSVGYYWVPIAEHDKEECAVGLSLSPHIRSALESFVLQVDGFIVDPGPIWKTSGCSMFLQELGFSLNKTYLEVFGVALCAACGTCFDGRGDSALGVGDKQFIAKFLMKTLRDYLEGD